MKHIMAAIDGSEPSYRALEHAAKLAKGLNAELSVLIVREFVVGLEEVYPSLNNDEIRDIKDKANEIIFSKRNQEILHSKLWTLQSTKM